MKRSLMLVVALIVLSGSAQAQYGYGARRSYTMWGDDGSYTRLTPRCNGGYSIWGDNYSGSITPRYGGGWSTSLYGDGLSYSGYSRPTFSGFSTDYDLYGPQISIYGNSWSRFSPMRSSSTTDWSEWGRIGRSSYGRFGSYTTRYRYGY